MDAGKTSGFITCSWTGRIWFNANELGEPEWLSRNSCDVILPTSEQLKELNLNPLLMLHQAWPLSDQD